MQTYLLLTKLSTDLSMQMKDRAEIGRNWLKQVREKCPEVKFIAHYALLGRYDFLDIYEAPDEETAAKVSFISQAHGALSSESMAAIPYKRFLEITEEIS
ncbi:MAG: GYD domain-containing protein [Bacteroidales bacterium]|nr:GYD domain-containing protein [Bacteroidales bacterium]